MILVTGATGTVGREVTGQLVATGERPRVLVRNRETARRLLGERVEYVTGDLDRSETLAAALAGVDRVFLVTRQSSRQLDQELGVIRAASRADVGSLVKLSVFRADERSPLQIARQHAQAERALEQSGLAHTILRPVFFMQNLIGMLRDDAFYTGAGDGRVAMIDARDIAAVAVAALTHPGQHGRTYTLTGPETLRFDDVASILARYTGRPVRHVRVPPEAVSAGLRQRGMQAWFADDMAQLHGMLADGYEDVVTDHVRAVTHRSPGSFARFTRDSVGAFGGPQQAGDRNGERHVPVDLVRTGGGPGTEASQSP